MTNFIRKCCTPRPDRDSNSQHQWWWALITDEGYWRVNSWTLNYISAFLLTFFLFWGIVKCKRHTKCTRLKLIIKIGKQNLTKGDNKQKILVCVLLAQFAFCWRSHILFLLALRFQFNKFDHVTHFIECKTDICLYTLMTKLSNLTLYNLVNI
jgi:hypothetical protein